MSPPTPLPSNGESENNAETSSRVLKYLSKNYDSWLKALHKKRLRKLDDKKNGHISPEDPKPAYDLEGMIQEIFHEHRELFPSSGNSTSNVEENVQNSDKDHKQENGQSPVNRVNEAGQQTSEQDSLQDQSKDRLNNPASAVLLVEKEMNFLKEKINELNILSSKVATHNTVSPGAPTSEVSEVKPAIARQISKKPQDEGFSLYGTKDEEGLHTYEGDSEDDLQDDYDLDEVTDDLYEGRTEHHIELELQPECDIHGVEPCNCPTYDEDFDEESYDFTFEYNASGQLVPTYDSVRQYMRAKAGKEFTNSLQTGKITEVVTKQKKNKKKKKAPAVVSPPSPPPVMSNLKFDPDAEDYCLLCDYEALYGRPPRQLLKWIDRKLDSDLRRGTASRKKRKSPQVGS